MPKYAERRRRQKLKKQLSKRIENNKRNIFGDIDLTPFNANRNNEIVLK